MLIQSVVTRGDAKRLVDLQSKKIKMAQHAYKLLEDLVDEGEKSAKVPQPGALVAR